MVTNRGDGVTRRSGLQRLRYLASLVVLLFGAGLWAAPAARAQAEPGGVYILEIEGVINPAAANYLQRGLDEAADLQAALVVIRLDTPGGLESSMRVMMQDMLASPVPIAAYVSPSGARAASAGLYLLMAADIAAMAPGTNTGAATPVAMGGGEMDEASVAKAVNDAAATIRALANERGRNAEWAEQAVREGVSVTAAEALELNVIEVVATDLDDLLAQIEGQTIQTGAGEVTLDLAEAPRVEAPMNFAENLLHAITDPNIAFILLSVGSLGILAELYNPGSLVPGITGIIALILAFFSLGNLPTNWAGVALVVLAIILFVAELSTEGLGVLGIGATIAFLLGGLILFRPMRPGTPIVPELTVNPWVVGGATAVMAAMVLIVIGQVARTRHSPVMTGTEGFIGRKALVHQDLAPTGRVWFEGQTWNARLLVGEPVPAGETVIIIGVDGLTLLVEPAGSGPVSRSEF